MVSSVRSSGMVNVIHGPQDVVMPLAGYSVAQARLSLRDVLNVDAAADAYLDGERVGGDHNLDQGNRLEYMRPNGKKGCGTYSVAQFMRLTGMSQRQFDQLGLECHIIDGRPFLSEREATRGVRRLLEAGHGVEHTLSNQEAARVADVDNGTISRWKKHNSFLIASDGNIDEHAFVDFLKNRDRHTAKRPPAQKGQGTKCRPTKTRRRPQTFA